MKINKQKLLTVLTGMQTNKSKVESLNNVNFKEKIIYQTNNDIMIYSEVLPEDLKESFSLPINELILLLSKIKDNEIELIVENTIKIKTEKTEIEFPKQEIKHKFDFENTFNWQDIPENFIKGIQFAGKILDANNERFNPIVFIDNDKIVSTDGRCLIVYNLKKDFLKFYLRKNQIDLLLKFNIKQYFIKENLIYFLSDNAVIYFNYLTDEKFPNYEAIQMENEKEIKFLNRLDINDIDINISILDSESKYLKVEIEKNNIKIKSSNFTGINIKTKFDKENQIEDKIIFSLVADYLIVFLKSDYSNEFKTFIDENKICFLNDEIKFITMLQE